MLPIHPQARTTPAVRIEIARSSEPTGVLARRYGVSAETIRGTVTRTGAKLQRPGCWARSGRSDRVLLGLHRGFVTLSGVATMRFASPSVRRRHRPRCATPRTPPLGKGGVRAETR